MKTKGRLLTILAVALLGGYSIYSSVRIRQLEGRLDRLQQEQLARPTPAQVTYAYDDSFLKYFGQEGVAEVERALAILRSPRLIERAPKSEEVDWDSLMNPLRLDRR
jgi:hypothetical protein